MRAHPTGRELSSCNNRNINTKQCSLQNYLKKLQKLKCSTQQILNVDTPGAGSVSYPEKTKRNEDMDGGKQRKHYPGRVIHGTVCVKHGNLCCSNRNNDSSCKCQERNNVEKYHHKVKLKRNPITCVASAPLDREMGVERSKLDVKTSDDYLNSNENYETGNERLNVTLKTRNELTADPMAVLEEVINKRRRSDAPSINNIDSNSINILFQRINSEPVSSCYLNLNCNIVDQELLNDAGSDQSNEAYHQAPQPFPVNINRDMLIKMDETFSTGCDVADESVYLEQAADESQPLHFDSNAKQITPVDNYLHNLLDVKRNKGYRLMNKTRPTAHEVKPFISAESSDVNVLKNNLHLLQKNLGSKDERNIRVVNNVSASDSVINTNSVDVDVGGRLKREDESSLKESSVSSVEASGNTLKNATNNDKRSLEEFLKYHDMISILKLINYSGKNLSGRKDDMMEGKCNNNMNKKRSTKLNRINRKKLSKKWNKDNRNGIGGTQGWFKERGTLRFSTSWRNTIQSKKIYSNRKNYISGLKEYMNRSFSSGQSVDKLYRGEKLNRCLANLKERLLNGITVSDIDSKGFDGTQRSPGVTAVYVMRTYCPCGKPRPEDQQSCQCSPPTRQFDVRAEYSSTNSCSTCCKFSTVYLPNAPTNSDQSRSNCRCGDQLHSIPPPQQTGFCAPKKYFLREIRTVEPKKVNNVQESKAAVSCCREDDRLSLKETCDYSGPAMEPLQHRTCICTKSNPTVQKDASCFDIAACPARQVGRDTSLRSCFDESACPLRQVRRVASKRSCFDEEACPRNQFRAAAKFDDQCQGKCYCHEGSEAHTICFYKDNVGSVEDVRAWAGQQNDGGPPCYCDDPYNPQHGPCVCGNNENKVEDSRSAACHDFKQREIGVGDCYDCKCKPVTPCPSSTSSSSFDSIVRSLCGRDNKESEPISTSSFDTTAIEQMRRCTCHQQRKLNRSNCGVRGEMLPPVEPRPPANRCHCGERREPRQTTNRCLCSHHPTNEPMAPSQHVSSNLSSNTRQRRRCACSSTAEGRDGLPGNRTWSNDNTHFCLFARIQPEQTGPTPYQNLRSVNDKPGANRSDRPTKSEEKFQINSKGVAKLDCTSFVPQDQSKIPPKRKIITQHIAKSKSSVEIKKYLSENSDDEELIFSHTSVERQTKVQTTSENLVGALSKEELIPFTVKSQDEVVKEERKSSEVESVKNKSELRLAKVDTEPYLYSYRSTEPKDEGEIYVEASRIVSEHRMMSNAAIQEESQVEKVESISRSKAEHQSMLYDADKGSGQAEMTRAAASFHSIHELKSFDTEQGNVELEALKDQSTTRTEHRAIAYDPAMHGGTVETTESLHETHGAGVVKTFETSTQDQITEEGYSHRSVEEKIRLRSTKEDSEHSVQENVSTARATQEFSSFGSAEKKDETIKNQLTLTSNIESASYHGAMQNSDQEVNIQKSQIRGEEQERSYGFTDQDNEIQISQNLSSRRLEEQVGKSGTRSRKKLNYVVTEEIDGVNDVPKVESPIKSTIKDLPKTGPTKTSMTNQDSTLADCHKMSEQCKDGMILQKLTPDQSNESSSSAALVELTDSENPVELSVQIPINEADNAKHKKLLNIRVKVRQRVFNGNKYRIDDALQEKARETSSPESSETDDERDRRSNRLCMTPYTSKPSVDCCCSVDYENSSEEQSGNTNNSCDVDSCRLSGPCSNGSGYTEAVCYHVLDGGRKQTQISCKDVTYNDANLDRVDMLVNPLSALLEGDKMDMGETRCPVLKHSQSCLNYKDVSVNVPNRRTSQDTRESTNSNSVSGLESGTSRDSSVMWRQCSAERRREVSVAPVYGSISAETFERTHYKTVSHERADEMKERQQIYSSIRRMRRTMQQVTTIMGRQNK